MNELEKPKHLIKRSLEEKLEPVGTGSTELKMPSHNEKVADKREALKAVLDSFSNLPKKEAVVLAERLMGDDKHILTSAGLTSVFIVDVDQAYENSYESGRLVITIGIDGYVTR